MRGLLLVIVAIAALIGILVVVILFNQLVGFVLGIIWLAIAITASKKWGDSKESS